MKRKVNSATYCPSNPFPGDTEVTTNNALTIPFTAQLSSVSKSEKKTLSILVTWLRQKYKSKIRKDELAIDGGEKKKMANLLLFPNAAVFLMQ